MTQSPNASEADRYSLSTILGVLTDGQTYRNLLYLALAFPLGMAYYVVLTVGLVLGVGLSVLIVGLGLLLGTIIGMRFIASFERRLANALLGTTISTPDDVEPAAEGFVETATAYLRAPSTWRGFGFVLLKFWIGILSFVLLVTFLGTGLELLLLPLFPQGVLNVEVAGWVVAQSFGTPIRRAVAVPTGAVVVVVACHVLNAFARANASIASSLLGSDEPDSVENTAPGQSV